MGSVVWFGWLLLGGVCGVRCGWGCWGAGWGRMSWVGLVGVLAGVVVFSGSWGAAWLKGLVSCCVGCFPESWLLVRWGWGGRWWAL